MSQAAPGSAAVTAAVRLAAARLCTALGWVALHEMRLPNGRRADLMALRPDGSFACIEVKSCLRDFATDVKWPDYMEYADTLWFAVDADFPRGVLPDEAGIMVAADGEACVLRDAPSRPLPPARRRALLHQFARLAAARLTTLLDPAGETERFAALRCE